MESNNYKNPSSGCDIYGKYRLELALFLKNNVFNKFKIDYSLENGTLLGAYRNNKFIPHDCGKDGVKLTKKFLNSAGKNLNKNGIILMPIISISDHKLIVKIIKKNFKFKLLFTKEWPAPKDLIKERVANFLKKKYIFKKFNLYLCFTKIYKLQSKN